MGVSIGAESCEVLAVESLKALDEGLPTRGEVKARRGELVPRYYGYLLSVCHSVSRL